MFRMLQDSVERFDAISDHVNISYNHFCPVYLQSACNCLKALIQIRDYDDAIDDHRERIDPKKLLVVAEQKKFFS